MANIVFKKVKDFSGFKYEAKGEFRNYVTFIRIIKKGSDWTIVTFEDSCQGETFATFQTLKDAKFYADYHFSL